MMLSETLSTASELSDEADGSLRLPGLTILCHPDVSRVGERALIAGPMNLDRNQPEFSDPSRPDPGARPLLDPHLSRQSIRLEPLPGPAALLDASATPSSVVVDGQRLEGDRRIRLDGERLQRGVVLLLARRVVLLLHALGPSAPVPPLGGLVGESAVMGHLRQEIRRVSDLQFPILLRGESGTGKELVARAIHEAGPRRDGPYVAVNLAAIPPTLAATELFGAAKGAYSGADQRRTGYFEQADGGTLLLDEIGEATPDVQVLLLRALESRQIQPIGTQIPRDVDVRVLAATDADLESAIERGDFRSPLLHRLANYEIRLPPLRERREDFGRLFFHFLRRELETLGQSDRLSSADAPRPWLDIPFLADLARCPWPGNVRELSNVVRQLAVGSRDADRMVVSETLRRSTAMALDAEVVTPAVVEPVARSRRRNRSFRDPAEVSRDEMLAALESTRFEVRAAAAHLAISRASFYNLMKRFSIPIAADISDDALLEAWNEHEGRWIDMAKRLKVSRQGLKRRLRQLGLL